MTNKMLQRVLNIIERASTEYDMQVDFYDTFEEACTHAEQIIDEQVDFDIVEVCDMSNHFRHLSYQNDDLFAGKELEVDGEFICSNERNNRYFWRDGDNVTNPVRWLEVPYYEVRESGDYFVAVHTVINDFGKKLLLVAPVGDDEDAE